MRPFPILLSLAAFMACPAQAADRQIGRWSLSDDDGICSAVLESEGASLALVLRPGGDASFAIVGPDIPAADANSNASIAFTFDEERKTLAGRATRRGSQTGYIVSHPSLPALLDAHAAGMKLSASIGGKRIFAIDAGGSAEAIATLKDCASNGKL